MICDAKTSLADCHTGTQLSSIQLVSKFPGFDVMWSRIYFLTRGPAVAEPIAFYVFLKPATVSAKKKNVLLISPNQGARFGFSLGSGWVNRSSFNENLIWHILKYRR